MVLVGPNPFLESNDKKFDIITMSHLPPRNHRIKDYNRLADTMSEDGVLIQIGDTQVDNQKMEEAGLEVAYDVHGVFIVWQKKKVEA